MSAAEGLDDIDRALLRELVTDGRATLAHLASAAGLSVSAVQSRVRRLESRGVISGYTARVAPEALGQQLSAFVAITPLDPSEPDDAPARLEHIREIESCCSVAGEDSYGCWSTSNRPGRWKDSSSGSEALPTCRPAARSFCNPSTTTDETYRNNSGRSANWQRICLSRLARGRGLWLELSLRRSVERRGIVTGNIPNGDKL